MISRRGFLAGLAAAFVADPERLLWVKSKTISIAAPPRIVLPPDPIEIVLKATARYAHQRFGLAVRITKEMLDHDDGVEQRMARELRRAMEATCVPVDAWTISRDVSVDRQAIQQRFSQCWLLPASRLPE